MAPPTAMFSFVPTCLCIGVLLLLLGHGAPLSTESCEAEYQKLQALDPILPEQRYEAGTVQYYNESSLQLGCVGASVLLATIDPEGLTVPRYIDQAGLSYALKGRGIVGYAFSGCPEIYYPFKQGDVIALPPGVTFWFYNDGDTPLELIYFFRANSLDDDLERKVKEFVLGGSNRDSTSTQGMLENVGGQNILSGFRTDLLGESTGLDGRLTRSLQGQDTQAINIVRAPGGVTRQVLPDVIPTTAITTCRIKLTVSLLEDPTDLIKNPLSPRRNTILTGLTFPILNDLGLSIERGTLSKDATISPLYTTKAQTVVYIVQGNARVQVVDNRGVAVFDGELRQRQLLVIPQYYVVLVKAGKDGLEYIAFKTDANPVINQIAGPGSILRALPVDVIIASYNVSTQDAITIKNSRGNQ